MLWTILALSFADTVTRTKPAGEELRRPQLVLLP